MTELLDPIFVPDEPEFQLPADGLLDPVGGDFELSAAAACTVCGASRVAGQDWCLECGTAFASPRAIPGLQTVVLASAFTLLLAGGAVAAGVAAVTDTLPGRKTEVKVVAQTAADPITSETPPLDDPLPPDTALDTDTFPYDAGPSPVPVPVDPGGGGTKPTSSRIELASDAASLYDPEGVATSYNDAKYAIAAHQSPSWFVTTPAGDTPGTVMPMDVGLNVSIGAAKKLTKLTLTTITPGFTVTVLGSDTAEPPRAIDDPAWKTLGRAASVDSIGSGANKPAKDDAEGDQTLSLRLGGQSKRYRTVVLWFTAPPLGGPTVRISQLKFFG